MYEKIQLFIKMQQMIHNNANDNELEMLLHNSKFIDYNNINRMPEIIQVLQNGRESKLCFLDYLNGMVQ